MSRKPQPAKTGLKPPLLHHPKGHDPEARQDTRAGSYDRKLQTRAGEVKLKVSSAFEDGL